MPIHEAYISLCKRYEGSLTKMNIKNILVPLDLVSSPCDALVFARNLAANAPVCVTLLYVLNLNVITPTGRQVCDELCSESERALRKLARLFFGTDRAARIVVRVGAPPQEIVAEAEAASADLIILTAPKRLNWKHLLRLGTTQKIIGAASCPAIVLPRHRKTMGQNPGVPAESDAALAEALLPAA
jgi:nucleotide-binding universal stress UspA family protein